MVHDRDAAGGDGGRGAEGLLPGSNSVFGPRPESGPGRSDRSRYDRPMPPRILTDSDVDRLDPAAAVAAVEAALRLKADGHLVAPPRVKVEVGDSDLVFTVGGSTGKPPISGFRVYGHFPLSPGRSNADHVVTVFDATDGHLEGVVVGSHLGALRTGAIGGAAVNALAIPDAHRLGVIGAGKQARTQVAATLAVRPIDEIYLHSRTTAGRDAFAEELGDRATIHRCDDAAEVVDAAQVLICATTSSQALFDADWVHPGTHVTTLGPKERDRHEVPIQLADRADLVVTDSLAQVHSYERPFIADAATLIELDQIVAGLHPGRRSVDAVTLFCSTGLAGTEVILAALLIEMTGEGFEGGPG